MNVALYCRLSKEDALKENESESIQNQKAMLLEYVTERGWSVYDIYTDDDYSGLDTARPAFNRLIIDAKYQRFQIIICKTQSRFTRDMELVERYIHGEFISWGIRFIGVLDGADTEQHGNKKSRQIHGLVNEWYVEDLSENIRAVFKHKRETGQYTGGTPLYGYAEDPHDKNKLVIDPVAASVVKRIFSLYIDGTGVKRIASILNGEGILNPTAYRESRGIVTNRKKTTTTYLWNCTTIGGLLSNQMYTGDMVQGCALSRSYKDQRKVQLPRDQWAEPLQIRTQFLTCGIPL